MARKKLLRSKLLPYHVTAHSNNREWGGRELYGAQIHAFVLMSNHFHLLVTTPDGNLDVVMRYLLRESCRVINHEATRINHVFGGPYKWSLIKDNYYYEHAIKYVYRNPVKAGICKQVEQYPYSSLNEKDINFTLTPSIFSKSCDIKPDLAWLNTPYSVDEDDCIRRALRHREFHFSPNRKTRVLPTLFQDYAK